MKNSQLVAAVVHSKRAKEGTIKVKVQNIKTNTKYRKQFKTLKFYQVHYDRREEIPVGTKVKIVPCAPVSKTKRFRIIEVENVTERK
jgi:small subunit ribosomal protein S17